jgi:hypothetical protein
MIVTVDGISTVVRDVPENEYIPIFVSPSERYADFR